MDTANIQLAKDLIEQIQHYQSVNNRCERYYKGNIPLKNLGISLPPQMSRIGTTSHWAKTIVDVLESRIIIKGVTHPHAEYNQHIRDLIRSQNMLNEISFTIKDSMIYGVGFLSVSTGDVDKGEPEILVNSESPSMTTGEWDSRTGKLKSAIKLIPSDQPGNQHNGYVLMLPNETITYDKQHRVIHRDVHNLGVVPMIRVANNVRSHSIWGQSEITEPVRYYIDNYIRTSASMEISREFHASPQRYILGANEEMFVDENTGEELSAWESYQGRFLALGRDEEDGSLPQVGSFAASSPEPYLKIIEQLAEQTASAAGIPPEYLGAASTTIPSSADAIRMKENAMISKIQRKLPTIEKSISDLFDVIFKFLDVDLEVPVRVKFADPETKTPGATTDSLQKLIAIGAFAPTSDYVYERLGLTPEEAEQARAEVQKNNLVGLLSQIPQAAEQARADSDVAQMNEAATSAPNQSGDQVLNTEVIGNEK